MPSSIQEAFAKALTQTKAHIAQPIPADWDDETPNATITEVQTMPEQATEKRTHFQTTNNVTRDTFNFVRDTPGLSRVGIVNALELKGHKRSSVFSLLGQMTKQGLLRENHGYMYAVAKEYAPIKQSVVRAKKTAPPPKRTVAKVETKVAKEVPANTLPQAKFNAEEFVGALTFKQAREVYDYLRTVFGG